jgi:hypothetical protein
MLGYPFSGLATESGISPRDYTSLSGHKRLQEILAPFCLLSLPSGGKVLMSDIAH